MKVTRASTVKLVYVPLKKAECMHCGAEVEFDDPEKDLLPVLPTTSGFMGLAANRNWLWLCPCCKTIGVVGWERAYPEGSPT